MGRIIWKDKDMTRCPFSKVNGNRDAFDCTITKKPCPPQDPHQKIVENYWPRRCVTYDWMECENLPELDRILGLYY